MYRILSVSARRRLCSAVLAAQALDADAKRHALCGNAWLSYGSLLHVGRGQVRRLLCRGQAARC